MADAKNAKVFCVGFHKTGTSSMGVLLESFRYRVQGAYRVRDEGFVDRLANGELEELMAVVGSHDAFQDTFLTVFRKAEGFRREARFSTWLYRVTANHCLMRLRKRSRRPIVDEPYSEPPAPGRLADELLETAEALELLRRSD